jgi:dGTPase
LLEYFRKFIFDENDEYVKRAQGMISKSIIKAALIENEMPLDESISKFNNYIKFRIIVDFISGMTDQYALNFYQKLNGQKIN